jgi:predicted membrane protein
MIAARIPWRSPWARLIPLMLLVMAPAAGQWLGWMMAPETLEPVSLVPGLASWTVIGTLLALLVKWSGLLTNPSLQMETWAQMPGASLAFLAAAVNAMLAKGVFESLSVFAALAYALACLWICANAFGSEFEHRTLGQWLVQPRSRGDLYREKLGVAGGIAGTAAVIFFLTTGQSMGHDLLELALIFGSLLILGLASAPFFTLISRSTLAGFVFTLTVPMALYLILQTLLDVYHARVYPDLLYRSSEEQEVLCVGGVIYLGAMALAGWRVFKRLEWREGGAGGSSTLGLYALTGAWDRWLGRRWLGKPATAQLIRKELRLHVVPWLIAGILIGFWGLSLLIRKWAPESELGVAASNPYTVTLYAGILGVFIFLVTGAGSIAEERVLGTLEWQWTQPIPMARQWRIKVGVATALALTLGLVLPAALVWLGFDAEALDTAFGQPDWEPIAAYAAALVALFATSLYASSVSQSSMKAVALTPMLLASLWAVGALTILGVGVMLDDQWGNLWEFPLRADGVRDPALLNQKPPTLLQALGSLHQISETGAMILGTIWIGFMVRSARVNAQRLRMGWPTVSRQWGRLSGGLWMASLLGGLMLVGLGRMRGYYDQLASLKYRREGFIKFATQAEREGKLTPEYLNQFGITNRPSPEALVDTLIRHRGFRWLQHNFVEDFQRDSLVAAKPRLLKASREELIQFATQAEQEGKMTPEYLSQFGITNRPSPEELVDFLIRRRKSGWLLQDFNKHFQGKPSINLESIRRYGRQTSPVSTTPSTNAASPESAAPVPMPMMSQELMKRYGIMPRTTTNRATPMPPKASTNPPANPAPRQ